MRSLDRLDVAFARVLKQRCLNTPLLLSFSGATRFPGSEVWRNEEGLKFRGGRYPLKRDVRRAQVVECVSGCSVNAKEML